MSWGVHDVSVRFGGQLALDGVTLEARPGEVHAVVGGDGAGKTTLLRVLAGLDLGAQGRIVLPGPGGIGFVPSDGGLFPDMTVRENIEFVADAYGLAGWEGRGELLLGRAGLASFGDRLAGKLSGGQRRKLAGSMAMLPAPQLLVLDELTTGVDPVSRVGLWRLIARAAAAGTAVVVATTYLDEAARAHSVAILHEGRVLSAGTPEAIKAEIPGSVVETDTPGEPSRAWRAGRRWREWVPEDDAAGRVTLEDAAIIAELRAVGRS